MTKNSGLKSGKKCNIREAAALFASKAKINVFEFFLNGGVAPKEACGLNKKNFPKKY